VSNVQTSIEGFRLSPQQARLWALQQGAHPLPYTARSFVWIEGELDPRLLETAVGRVVGRHEILRTTFRHLSAMTLPLQVIADDGARPAIVTEDLSGWTEAARRARIEALELEASGLSFDFERGPLFDARLLRVAPARHLLVLTLPAMCADRAGLENLVRELADAYAGRQDEEPVQYADLAEWQHELLESPDTEAGREYWRGRDLPDFLTLRLPFENRAGNQEDAGPFAPQSLAVPVGAELAARIESLAARRGTSPANVLLACFSILLHRLTGQADIVTGANFEQRKQAELQAALGLFARVLPVHCRLEETSRFDHVLEQVEQVTRELHKWQEYFSWERIAGSNGHTPFFPYCFEYSRRGDDYAAGAIRFSIARSAVCTERFKLKLAGLHSTDSVDAMSLAFQYDSRLYRREEIARLSEQYLVLLDSAATMPEAAIADLKMLSQDERAHILRRFNPAPLGLPPAQVIHQLIAAQALRCPEARAVVVEDQELTYGELNRRANQLAHFLQSKGVGPEVLVGLCLERSVELLVGMLGILKAGGAYLPLDPALPAERLAGMIADARPAVLLTHSQSPIRDSQSAILCCLDTEWETIARESEAEPQSDVGPENLVYVLFTSGSTGRPKGVALEHRQLCAYVQGVSGRLGLPEGASYATVTTFAADLGHTAVFPSLAGGGCLHVVKQERAADAAAMAEYWRRHQVDCLKIVPSHLGALLTDTQAADLLPRRRLVLGGEASSWELIKRVKELRPDCRVLNHYGPTETTVGVLTCEVAEAEPRSATVPLGRPLPAVQVYVLDSRLEPAPVWMAGEVYIGGHQVARGYLNAPDQTAQRFVPDPFSETPGARMYRTGDLARYLPDGQVEFLGRVDHQVKIRGYRIELGEIEAVLEQHPAVQEAVVLAVGVMEKNITPMNPIASEDKRLVAYIVESANTPVGELRKYVADRLPEYMTPSVVVKLDRLPLTANGKLDRAALPEPEEAEGREYVAPRTQIEELLAGIWAEVLKLDAVGIHDDFFDLGGHSLLVTRVASRVSEAFQVELPFQVFFEKRTVAELGASLEAARRGEEGVVVPPMQPIPRDSELPLSFAQQRLWFFDQLEPNSSAYNIPGAVRLSGRLDRAALEQTLSELVRRHEVLRTRFPGGASSQTATQVIAPTGAVRLDSQDLRHLPPAQRDAEAARLAAEEAVRPFKLDEGPLLRVSLLALRDDEHILLFTMHHIISDAWSMAVLVREVAALYKESHRREPVDGSDPAYAPILPEPRCQYADFAHWQRQWLRGEVLEKQVAYWKRQLDGMPPALSLPTDQPRPAVQTFRGERHFFDLDQPLSDALKSLARREGATLFMTLLAAFKALLRRAAAQDDVVVGTNVANRNHAGTEEMIGFFINQLVLRTDCGGDPTFRDLLRRVRDGALGAYANQDLPFDKLVEELQPPRDMSRSLLFQVKFELQEGLNRAMELPGLVLTPIESDHKVVRHDLHLSMWERDAQLTGALQYNVDLFTAATAARIAEDFAALLARIAEQPDARLHELDQMLAEKDRQRQETKEKELEEASLEKLKTRRRKAIS
jgi:amino acid adenylation domain-containing protein